MSNAATSIMERTKFVIGAAWILVTLIAVLGLGLVLLILLADCIPTT